ncbi:DUF1269 domain-containing protein [Acrocarpospora macrocephala]|uniref:Membrane protein n=1 Tax=Acrocarpospora macrocephala TaxID=150177 RepID=A0A5M3X3Z9_9ACTN|nr:DUF1269 domain-containing protein [Acrocarpospora macrocephala]GES12838.1 membrane protein [Acrocarpospora macrocephala]
MANLIAIAYDDVSTAVDVRDKVQQLQKERLIELRDMAIVERTMNGKIKMKQMVGTTGAGAAGGALWGGLIGLIFFMPFLGMAVGAATGAAIGAMSDVGVDDKFMKDLAEGLKPGAAALFLLIDKSTPDKVIPQLAPYGGRIIHTSLSKDQEDQLKHAVAAARG